MDQKTLYEQIILAWAELNLNPDPDSAGDLGLNRVFWEDNKQKKEVRFECSVHLDVAAETVVYWERTEDSGKGFFGDGDTDTTVQMGKTLYRKVKHEIVNPKGETELVDLNLGQISQAVKTSAKEAGWKFKVVLRKDKATASLAQPETTQPTPTKSHPSPKPRRKGLGLGFMILWGLLAVAAFGSLLLVEASWIGYLVALILLVLGVILRLTLMKGFVKGLLLLVVTAGLLFVTLALTMGDSTLERDAGNLESAFAAKDLVTIETCLHPETRAELIGIFEEHQAELDRIAVLMQSRKLVYQDQNYAEYEVTENGQTFTMVFERVGETWLLVRF